MNLESVGDPLRTSLREFGPFTGPDYRSKLFYILDEEGRRIRRPGDDVPRICRLTWDAHTGEILDSERFTSDIIGLNIRIFLPQWTPSRGRQSKLIFAGRKKQKRDFVPFFGMNLSPVGDPLKFNVSRSRDGGIIYKNFYLLDEDGFIVYDMSPGTPRRPARKSSRQIIIGWKIDTGTIVWTSSLEGKSKFLDANIRILLPQWKPGTFGNSRRASGQPFYLDHNGEKVPIRWNRAGNRSEPALFRDQIIMFIPGDDLLVGFNPSGQIVSVEGNYSVSEYVNHPLLGQNIRVWVPDWKPLSSGKKGSLHTVALEVMNRRTSIAARVAGRITILPEPDIEEEELHRRYRNWPFHQEESVNQASLTADDEEKNSNS